MKPTIEKVVQEYVISVVGLEFSVKARISEFITGSNSNGFHWSVSHHYSGTENGHPYIPSVRILPTLEEAEFLLMAYIENFTPFSVVPDEFY